MSVICNKIDVVDIKKWPSETKVMVVSFLQIFYHILTFLNVGEKVRLTSVCGGREIVGHILPFVWNQLNKLHVFAIIRCNVFVGLLLRSIMWAAAINLLLSIVTLLVISTVYAIVQLQRCTLLPGFNFLMFSAFMDVLTYIK